MKKVELNKWEKGFRLVALILLSVAAWAGIMSVIKGADEIRYVISAVVVFWLSKELL